MRMKLAWLSNSRPDCPSDISQLSQVTEDLYNDAIGALRRIYNKAVKYAVDNRVQLKIATLKSE